MLCSGNIILQYFEGNGFLNIPCLLETFTNEVWSWKGMGKILVVWEEGEVDVNQGENWASTPNEEHGVCKGFLTFHVVL